MNKKGKSGLELLKDELFGKAILRKKELRQHDRLTATIVLGAIGASLGGYVLNTLQSINLNPWNYGLATGVFIFAICFIFDGLLLGKLNFAFYMCTLCLASFGLVYIALRFCYAINVEEELQISIVLTIQLFLFSIFALNTRNKIEEKIE